MWGGGNTFSWDTKLTGIWLEDAPWEWSSLVYLYTLSIYLVKPQSKSNISFVPEKEKKKSLKKLPIQQKYPCRNLNHFAINSPNMSTQSIECDIFTVQWVKEFIWLFVFMWTLPGGACFKKINLAICFFFFFIWLMWHLINGNRVPLFLHWMPLYS